jgi:hypothetical protein
MGNKPTTTKAYQTTNPEINVQIGFEFAQFMGEAGKI